MRRRCDDVTLLYGTILLDHGECVVCLIHQLNVFSYPSSRSYTSPTLAATCAIALATEKIWNKRN